MASLFDQYEQASSKSYSTYKPAEAVLEPIQTSGFISASLDDETPIFSKQRINFSPPGRVTHTVVCNNFLVMALTNNMLLRIDLENPGAPDEVEVTKPGTDKIHEIFLDPTGRHLLVSMSSQENYYLSRNSKKPKLLGRMKGHQIDSVGWNLQNTSETTTGSILLGTSKGLIFETEIQSGEDSRFFQATLEQYWKQLFNLGRDRPAHVTGLAFEKIPSGSMNEYKYFVLATTPGRLYQFLGNIPSSTEPPMFQHVFESYLDMPESFLELPGNFGYSKLQLYYPKYRGLPTSFAWMTGPGIYYGKINPNATKDSVTTDTKLMPYPKDDENKSKPIDIVLTEFHVLILFPDRLKAICVLNEQLIFDDVYAERHGVLQGLCKDPVRGTIWAYTDQSIFKYKITRETRDVWQMFLDRGEFELAMKYCEDNPANKDKVLTRQAEQFYKDGQYEKSAKLFALTLNNSLEEVALKFIQTEQKDALKVYLIRKLKGLKDEDKTQITMLVTWLTEIYLNQLGELKEQGQDMNEDYDALQDEFRKFLAFKRVKDCVTHNRNTIYDLIASHGDVEDLIYFATLMEDFERVITHYVQHDNYREALETLAKHCTNDTELVYKFSPLLMQHVPKETVDVWIHLGRQLDPKKLIPALVQYDHEKRREQDNEAIRYLEFSITTLDNKDEAIHNYLLSLYAKLQPDKLMAYLKLEGEDQEEVSYDVKYALRLCAEHDQKRACVHIYSTMGLYEEAVDLALQVDVDLAKHNADKPEDDLELKKKLWLRIARHVVEEEKDIKRAMAFLHECDLLKIEDILPFFPDFVTIDHFKDAICTSLQEYNQHIEKLKEEMEEATQSAKDIRGDIQSFRNKFAFVKGQDKCSSCGFPLMTRTFHVFPCMHKFHTDCLTTEVLPHLSTIKRTQVEDLQRKLASSKEDPTMAIPELKQNLTGTQADLRASLDEIVATECVFCGEYMIKSIDLPFIKTEEYDDVMKTWL
ncbi:vacuolar protein sorting-associated protein 18 homolog [Lingula anatina]|uniref:Vacuolar protein sorting-associated protein 18 homolog n=1 Tax=Lingula anatina TaxID=7574 RepID=A0A2R2MJ62_LINAN|nr:vacuolar protein sorting-associated protein 18 homolog [Lingula anatina]|eukprot:XP_023930234.1 vacuolar protein sorting-associated protein 18 homolog [Lingula anatina]